MAIQDRRIDIVRARDGFESCYRWPEIRVLSATSVCRPSVTGYVRSYVLPAVHSFLFAALLVPPFVISVTAGSANNKCVCSRRSSYSPYPVCINQQLAAKRKNDFPLLLSLRFRHRVWLQMPWHGIVLLSESKRSECSSVQHYFMRP